MPRQIDLNAELDYLRYDADPNAERVYAVPVPTPIATRLVEECIDRLDTQPSRGIVALLGDAFRCLDHGVMTAFDPDTRRQLDTAATAMGLERESLVRMIVSENLSSYLRRAKDELDARNRNERILQRSLTLCT